MFTYTNVVSEFPDRSSSCSCGHAANKTTAVRSNVTLVPRRLMACSLDNAAAISSRSGEGAGGRTALPNLAL